MASKFSVRNLFPLTNPSAFFPLSNYVQQALKSFTLQQHRKDIPPLVDDSHLSDWQTRFQFIPLLNDTPKEAVKLVKSGSRFSNNIIRNFHSHVHRSNPEKSKDKSSNISYSILPKERSEDLSTFLLQNYIRQEPVTLGLGIPITEIDGWFQRYIRSSLYSSVCDVSMQAIDEASKQRIGVLTSIIIGDHSARPLEPNYTGNKDLYPTYQHSNEFYNTLEQDLDVVRAAGLQGNPKVLEHMYISVHLEYNGQGVAFQMANLVENMAANINDCRVGYVGYALIRNKVPNYMRNLRGIIIFVGSMYVRV